jgi:transposase-like protein
MTTKGTGKKKEKAGEAGAERSEAEASPEAATRGWPGRRSAEERTGAVLELLSGKTTVDQLARRFGVYPSTIEKWREVAIESMQGALRQGNGKTPRELELERRVKDLERAFTDVAIKKELLERFLAERPTRPGRFVK